MSESDIPRFPMAELIDRLELVLQELRRQGRAAVAAQAAAESCLAEIQQFGETARPAPGAAEPWLVPLLPAFDALDASVAQAATLQRELGRARWLSALPPLRRLTEDVHAFLQGVGMLRAQLDRALEQAGIQVDRDTGVAVDPNRHRVLEVRAGPRGAGRGQVLQVLRAGYHAGPRCLREAEVQASAAGDAGRGDGPEGA